MGFFRKQLAAPREAQHLATASGRSMTSQMTMTGTEEAETLFEDLNLNRLYFPWQ